MILIIAAISLAPLAHVVIDSKIGRHEALSGKKIPEAVSKYQVLLSVEYVGFDGKLHHGQIVVHKKVAQEVRAIFNEIRRSRFPIARMIPVASFAWQDRRSMKRNNTSGFNYRLVEGGHKLSVHASGLAIDINPYQNPDEGMPNPKIGKYDPKKPGAITRRSAVYRAFRKHGWRWGGNWPNRPDYQHFYKP